MPTNPTPAPSPEPAAPSGRVQRGAVKRIQMADIARMAGVSTATVSRALSGSPLIQQETRERIADLARSLNYRVNASAASLRRKDLSTVGVVMLDNMDRPIQAASDPFMMAMVASLADALADSGQDMLLARYGQNRIDRLPDLVETGRVAGLIVMGQWSWHDQLNALARRGVPMAVWGASVPGTLYPVVGCDNEAGGYLATRHLVEQGCRRIAFLGDVQHPEAALRHQGYLRALREAGHVPRDIWQKPIVFAAPSLNSIVQEWVSGQSVPDGVFASSDLAAMGLVRALSAHGLAVPADVRVVGFDDIALAEHFHPSISTVRQSMATAGPALVGMLTDRLQGIHPDPLVLPAELIVRESSLSPRG
jgi:DNA-binding LacI/PurR family transcriptional regulator